LARRRSGSRRQLPRSGRPRRREAGDDHPCDAHAGEVPEVARTMTEPRSYGQTKSGKAITDTDIESLADEAEKGYDVDALIARRGKRGRPPLGTAPASVESVRLDPALRNDLAERARVEGLTTSELIRKALTQYLRPAG